MRCSGLASLSCYLLHSDKPSGVGPVSSFLVCVLCGVHEKSQEGVLCDGDTSDLVVCGLCGSEASTKAKKKAPRSPHKQLRLTFLFLIVVRKGWFDSDTHPSVFD